MAKQGRKYVKKVLPAEAVERTLKHVLGHTFLILRYDLNSSHHSLLLKEGLFSTFEDFFKGLGEIEFETHKKPHEDVFSLGLIYLKKKLPAQFLDEYGG